MTAGQFSSPTLEHKTTVLRTLPPPPPKWPILCRVGR